MIDNVDKANALIPLKQPTTYEEQIHKIRSRGCLIDDETYAKNILKQINYYRLTAYFLPYKESEDKYISGTSFETMYRTYEFDRKLRKLLLGTVEEIEIMLRSQISYYHAHTYGALGYKRKDVFNPRHKHEKFLDEIKSDIAHNRNQPSVKHHQDKYDGNFPIWVIIELFTIGQLSFFYTDMIRADKKAIARNLYHTTDSNLESWLKCLTELRNYCAHYSRLYNSNFASRPATPKDFPYTLNRKVFDYILVLKFLYYDQNNWANNFVIELQTLIEEYLDSIELKRIGFPDDWKSVLVTPNPQISQNNKNLIG